MKKNIIASEIKEITIAVIDPIKCEICGTLTPLHCAKLCYQCWEIKQFLSSLLQNKASRKIAKIIIKSIEKKIKK